MIETPRRRLIDRVSPSPTFMGQGTVMTGDLQCPGDLVVAGRCTGDCIVTGAFTLTEGARWEGRLKAHDAIIVGEMQGDLLIEEKIEIRRSARIRGSVTARSIAVAKGAVVEGDLNVSSGGAVVHYEEKRLVR